jgi:hypothetical protein
MTSVSGSRYHFPMTERPGELHPTTWRVLSALRAGARLSRNRHFYLYADPRVRHAEKLHRFLRSVLRDVRAHPEHVRVERVVHGDQVALRIEIPQVAGRRVAFLRPFEIELLAAEAPEVARVLTDALA